ncbi:hypothetical protein CTAM01_17090 [Colletotrichum tamarilloi]|uniref:Uncharacterized protein n=1 Tax=Colletotrichum tamarilloi TaxID=1209934 RepID=A0ABQ9QGN0_9PEZI|nr:uncharacterized protein CTAM01_17090 [Colletotrichum tamarilloi]KAK1463554.1 hypothetical protein CTAM01_17090 [Colletotrichum tamarilloi]
MRYSKETEFTPTNDFKNAGIIKIGYNLYYYFIYTNITGYLKALGATKLPKYTK